MTTVNDVIIQSTLLGAAWHFNQLATGLEAD